MLKRRDKGIIGENCIDLMRTDLTNEKIQPINPSKEQCTMRVWALSGEKKMRWSFKMIFRAHQQMTRNNVMIILRGVEKIFDKRSHHFVM
jgi:hypothetical protein